MKTFQYNRWYDKVDKMTDAVHVIQVLPQSLQGLIAKNLNDYLEALRKERKNERNVVSIGVPAVLQLYKAQNKQRWYDANSELRRALNLMHIAPPRFLAEFAERVIKIEELIREKLLETDKNQPQTKPTSNLVKEINTLLTASYVTVTQEGQSIKLIHDTNSPSSEEPQVSGPNSPYHRIVRPDPKNPKKK